MTPALVALGAIFAVQVSLGGITVFLANSPLSVMLHWGMGMALLADLTFLAVLAIFAPSPRTAYAASRSRDEGVAPALAVAAAFAFATMCVGAYVSSSYAGLACAHGARLRRHGLRQRRRATRSDAPSPSRRRLRARRVPRGLRGARCVAARTRVRIRRRRARRAADRSRLRQRRVAIADRAARSACRQCRSDVSRLSSSPRRWRRYKPDAASRASRTPRARGRRRGGSRRAREFDALAPRRYGRPAPWRLARHARRLLRALQTAHRVSAAHHDVRGHGHGGARRSAARPDPCDAVRRRARGRFRGRVQLRARSRHRPADDAHDDAPGCDGPHHAARRERLRRAPRPRLVYRALPLCGLRSQRGCRSQATRTTCSCTRCGSSERRRSTSSSAARRGRFRRSSAGRRSRTTSAHRRSRSSRSSSSGRRRTSGRSH